MPRSRPGSSTRSRPSAIPWSRSWTTSRNGPSAMPRMCCRPSSGSTARRPRRSRARTPDNPLPGLSRNRHPPSVQSACYPYDNGENMRIARILAAAVLTGASILATTAAFGAEITGAGATFPYPIYAKWAEADKQQTGTGLNYQSIGSGGGIKQITAKTVDFGASDMPLKGEDLQKNDLVQFPAIMGGVVPVVNLEGIRPGQLKFTGAVLGDIYLGKITKWN